MQAPPLPLLYATTRSPIAQPVEQAAVNRKVPGSSPGRGARKPDVYNFIIPEATSPSRPGQVASLFLAAGLLQEWGRGCHLAVWPPYGRGVIFWFRRKRLGVPRRLEGSELGVLLRAEVGAPLAQPASAARAGSDAAPARVRRSAPRWQLCPCGRHAALAPAQAAEGDGSSGQRGVQAQADQAVAALRAREGEALLVLDGRVLEKPFANRLEGVTRVRSAQALLLRRAQARRSRCTASVTRALLRRARGAAGMAGAGWGSRARCCAARGGPPLKPPLIVAGFGWVEAVVPGFPGSLTLARLHWYAPTAPADQAEQHREAEANVLVPLLA